MTATADAAAPGPSPTGAWERFRHFREKNHLAFEVAFFFAGFLFDYLLLHRIDSRPLLIHQGSYLVLLSVLLMVDHRFHTLKAEPIGFWGRVLSFRHWVIHFFLGTLLNAFLIFYFKASSGFFSFLFIVALAVVLVVNELPRFRELGPVLRVGLWSFAVTSYLAYLIPVLWGALHPSQYLAAVVVGAAATVGLWRLFRRFTHDDGWSFARAAAPGLAVQLLLLLLYVLKVVPPVPLNLRYIGIFQEVTRVKEGDRAGQYALGYALPASMLPRVFEFDGSELFARPDDKAWAFVELFAPEGFHDQIAFAWEFDDPKKGWVEVGAPYTTTLGSGREQGFRTFGNRTIARTGDYRVKVLTSDGREIGRKSFTVVRDESQGPRVLEQLYR
ncbi:MAG: DUF2914 domain-containing protein [Myxococcaceae bacterium]|nr:DUF2914 domain-containing protein [Myxococcaceae bacterium]